MKNITPILLSLSLLLSIDAFAQSIQPINIVPNPVVITPGQGEFIMMNSTRILIESDQPDVRRVAEYLSNILTTSTTYDIKVSEYSNNGTGHIRLILTEDSFFDETTHPALLSNPTGPESIEAYSLVVKESGVTIAAKHPSGLFMGVQTLRQLLPAYVEANSYTIIPNGVKWVIPAVEISDYPRFGYRGMHLDVGRHFMPVEFVKQYIDMLAKFKQNTFHWHLTEDQGWRIEIKRYPLLTEIGAWRDSTLIGNYGSGRYDNIRYGGYYTQDEIRDVVAYARDRFITIIPEIELPGHASAALAAYPEFGCTDLNHPYHVQSTWGIFPEIFCPTEETFDFLKNILTEVMDLFPGPFIHIGGDEAMKDHWNQSQIAQSVIQREGLADEDELQSYFIHRIDEFLDANGRRLLGWDEILEGGLAPNATVMSWRGESGAIAAAQLGHHAIMSPTSHAYLDYYQSRDRENEPIAIGGFLPLDKVYSYEPIPMELDPQLHHYILGAQANIWTEYMKTTSKVEYMAYPRALAMAEVVWSQSDRRSWDDFMIRLNQILKRLDVMEINYRSLD